MLLAATGCGGGSDDASETGQDAATPTDGDASGSDADAATDSGDADDGVTAGFGELIEGTFVLSGASDQEFSVGDDGLSYITTGGCQGGEYGFGVTVLDDGAQMPFAQIGVQGQEDLSGGATGEFAGAALEVSLFPDADSPVESYEGPVTMVISEHDTGGADFDLNERRMTVSLFGTIPSDAGDLDVDVTYRWVMGCP